MNSFALRLMTSASHQPGCVTPSLIVTMAKTKSSAVPTMTSRVLMADVSVQHRGVTGPMSVVMTAMNCFVTVRPNPKV